MLTAISPIDGRYAAKTKTLQSYFSEFALIKYRIRVEIAYFKALVQAGLPQLQSVTTEQIAQLEQWALHLAEADAEAVKTIEKTTNHDVKAVEYAIKNKMEALGMQNVSEFIHFGLTSQDINNTAIPLSIKEGLENVLSPLLQSVESTLLDFSKQWAAVPLLARTHGQSASPTRLGKEIEVFAVRLQHQVKSLSEIPHCAKFGGATGNFNAHFVAYPDRDWHAFGDHFVQSYLGLTRSHPTTQIEHYDHLAAQCHAMCRINTLLIDFCRDIWTYVSMDYFKQKVVAGEVGSSAMPHKVNPIDFENAEGNFGMANAILGHLAEKLPISRLQRDLTDSTVLRNIGVPLGHMVIALQSLLKGCSKLLLNEAKLEEDLEKNWIVTAEAIQTILRREGYPQPYEALKALTRGKAIIGKQDMHDFIKQLEVAEEIKEELYTITPQNYVGR